MKITVLGATGGTGLEVVGQACAAGHDVIAVVRDPAGITLVHPRLTVVRADAMDTAALRPAVAGRDAVVSTLGSRAGRAPTTVCTDGITAAITAMRAEGVRRLVAVSASGLATEGDDLLTRVLAKPILQRVLRHTFADMTAMEEVMRATPDLDWTIIRPPMLTNGPRSEPYRSAVDRNVPRGYRISRANLADCILRCLSERAPLAASVAIAS
ncbi:putative NADH-flavin reductase [Actinoalloteichus sp. GBA129-24]|uniref:NADH-flavin reductase n=2 Tax=Pseudonocardiaceae TaxID=2070 RepID=A0AAC9L9E4_9PSEU|nr:putative NADH-flavin reductase [Actinoalloteichus fjordicus]APU18730.1 putative NADH-flavin reductase [Actinoalloteichus sp. GBA129-24]